jgi:hypothetical protein
MTLGQDSSVGVANPYGLDGQGDRIPVKCVIFHKTSRPALGPTQPLYRGYQVIPSGKMAGA